MRRCLKAIEANTQTPYTLIISDDCSPDPQMQEYLNDLMQDHYIQRNETQLGFPANVNRAAELASSEFLCLLNQDTRVCRGWMEALLKEMEDPAVGIVGCKLLYPREKGEPWGDTIQHAGVANDSRGPFHIWRGMPKDYPPANVRREINCVTFACVLIRKSLWDELEGLDEGFVGGQYEDVGFAWASREMGWKVVYTPDAVVYHYEHGAGEEWVSKSSAPNRNRLMELFPHQPSDTHLFETLDNTVEGMAQFVHQIRAAAISWTLQYRKRWDHPFRISTMAYEQLPECEKEWAREHARRLMEVVK